MQENKSGMIRGEQQLDIGAEQFVTAWQSKIRSSKKFFDDDFKRMREDMKLSRQGASDEWVKQGNYVIPIINRYINQSVAALYAKNPKAYAEKRKTLDFTVWDGKPETAQAAVQGVGEAVTMGLPANPEHIAILEDIEQARQKKDMLDKIGKTMEVLFDYFSNEQKPRLKPSMKAMVRRAKTCGVAYLMLGFQRQYALSPDETAQLADARSTLAEMQRRMQDYVDDEMGDKDKEVYELERLIETLSKSENKILREGPLFMFPKATQIIVDPNCKQLMGFIGAGWIVREFHKSCDEIKKLYKVDIGKGYTPYKQAMKDGNETYHIATDSDGNASMDNDESKVCVWEVYNKDLNETFTIADGYKGFLKPCSEPDYYVEGFWPVFAITFNDSETEDKLYPLSDVHALRHVQSEYNRSREYRRIHREANKPKYMVMKGRLSEADKKLLESHPPHAVIELDGLDANVNINNILQQFKPQPMDPALYETNSEMEDVLRTVGAQEANIGGMSGGTATESSIAESGRMTSLASNVDDLDEFLTDVVTAVSQLMITEISPETAKEIAGVGAVWPQMNREQVAKQVYLKIRAGSSGRPNKAAELANMERGMPYLLQLPGVNPYPLGKRYADLLEINMDDIIIEGMPSITALNSLMGRGPQQMGAGTENDPQAQGANGSNNAPSAQENEQGPQPSYQTPAPGMM